jgi:hypothetical protein
LSSSFNDCAFGVSCISAFFEEDELPLQVLKPQTNHAKPDASQSSEATDY